MPPPKCFPRPDRLFYQIYFGSAATVQQILDSLPGLGVALVYLHRLHVLTAFVNARFRAAQGYTCRGPDGVCLRAEYHPSRGKEFKTAGLERPPKGVASPPKGPRLDPRVFAWMQSLRQYFYRRKLRKSEYNFLVQISPFARDPRGPNHFVMTATRREPLDWRPRGPSTLRRRVIDMLECAAQLNGFVLLWNGDGAGGTIRDWFHVHLLRTRRTLGIQLAARRASRGAKDQPLVRFGEPYWPMPAFRVRGTPDFIARKVVILAENWTRIAGSRATECIAILREGEFLDAYYIPRDRARETVVGFEGLIGAYESCGVLITSDPVRAMQLAEGRIGFEEIRAVLKGAAPEFEWREE